MSPRQGSPVPRELLPPHIGRCPSSATSIFQPPPSCHTTTSLQHARPSGILRCRSDGLECAAWRPPKPVAQCRQFPEEAKDASVSEWTLSALEALRNALYKFKTYLLFYLHCHLVSYYELRWSLWLCIGQQLLPPLRGIQWPSTGWLSTRARCITQTPATWRSPLQDITTSISVPAQDNNRFVCYKLYRKRIFERGMTRPI